MAEPPRSIAVVAEEQASTFSTRALSRKAVPSGELLKRMSYVAKSNLAGSEEFFAAALADLAQADEADTARINRVILGLPHGLRLLHDEQGGFAVRLGPCPRRSK